MCCIGEIITNHHIMKEIVILGNGFDLAHDLKTGYKDFVREMLMDSFRIPPQYPNSPSD